MTEYQITEYNQTAAALAELQNRYGRLFDVTTPKGMEEARKARAEVRGYRVALESLRKEIKAPALERARLIDDEAKRITAELLKIEEPIDEAIKKEETRKAEERAAKARAEVARVAGIAARIAAIRNRIGTVANQPAAMISAALEQLHALELVPEAFEEFMPDAITALDETRTALETLLDERIGYEAEQVRLKAEQDAKEAQLKAEREELEQLRKADAARQAEQARIEADARQAREAEQARHDAEAQKAREAEAARLQAEREKQARKDEAIRQQQAVEAARIATAKAELDERQRRIEEREAKAKAEAEAKEKAAKAKSRGKAKADPLADLKQAASAGTLTTLDAIDQAYQLGFNAGLQAAQQAA